VTIEVEEDEIRVKTRQMWNGYDSDHAGENEASRCLSSESLVYWAIETRR